LQAASRTSTQMTLAPNFDDSNASPTAPTLESVILRLCAEIGAGKSICPSEAAKAIALETGGGELAWRDWLLKVRRSAVALAHAGQLVIYRKGKPVDPDDFRGVYRLGLPRSE